MPNKTTDSGGQLTLEEERAINEALTDLKAFVGRVSYDLQPHALADMAFKVADQAYNLKGVIDRVSKAANLRLWHGNVREFRRGVSPQSKATPLADTASQEDIEAALTLLGLLPSNNGSPK